MRREILAAEGLQRKVSDPVLDIGLRALESAFPDQTFPMGSIHEFISPDTENAAATTGFIAALLGTISLKKGPCIWISRNNQVFAPALISFGLRPDQVIFISPDKDKDLLWTIEQALKCSALTAVVADVQHLDLTTSRRLQLAVEQSRVTGLLHRRSTINTGHTASVARWQIQALSSSDAGVPGMGYPRWQVNLLKVRNGKPGSWIVEWSGDKFQLEAISAKSASRDLYNYPKVAG